MTERAPDKTIDLRGTPCPLNWVKTKLRLEEMDPGRWLEVVVDEGNPATNVPRSAEGEGHRIVAITPTAGAVHVLIEKGAA
jgi:tRNA 2-thiouridine synthesizing protein A